MTLQLPTNPPPPPQKQPDQRQPSPPPRSSTYDLIAILVVGIAMAVVTLLVILFIQQNNDSTITAATEDTVITAPTLPRPENPSTSQAATPAPTPAESTTTSTAATATTTPSATSVTETSTDGPGTTATTGPAIEQNPTQPFVWPQLTSEPGFITPEAAARSFAGFLAGYADPTFSEFRQGDNRSGEIDIQPTPNGPTTTILLRQIGPQDTWAVIGATTENITINQPTTGANLANPITLTGRTQTPDGNLHYALYSHGQTDPIAAGTITTQATNELEPFTATIDWPDRPAGPGTLRLFTTNPNDGSIRETTVIPVRL